MLMEIKEGCSLSFSSLSPFSLLQVQTKDLPNSTCRKFTTPLSTLSRLNWEKYQILWFFRTDSSKPLFWPKNGHCRLAPRQSKRAISSQQRFGGSEATGSAGPA